jgi:hypothetical protein
MTTGREKIARRPRVRLAAITILLLGTLSAAAAAADPLRDLIGPPLSNETLERTSGQGMETSLGVEPTDTSIIEVILWDEAKRPPPPQPTDTGGTTSLTSTVNGQPY